MQTELLIFASIIVAYGTFTTLAIIGIGRLHRKPDIKHHSFSGFISIIISARDEGANIKECLHQITKQTFPIEKFELILIDDASGDNTLKIAEDFLKNSTINYQLIQQSEQQGKKKNISQGIAIAKGDIIITSDADVVYKHSNWLKAIASYFEQFKPNLLILPVDFETQRGVLPTFQILENIALTAITAGFAGLKKAFMCNGANLAFKKHAFESVDGYNAHMHISSGEDVFLLEAIKKLDPTLVHYFFSRELIVKTKPQKKVKDFLNQRIRWAYKAKYNSNFTNFTTGIIILLANLIFVAFFIGLIQNSLFLPYLAIFVAAKLLFDFLLLFLASDFLGRVKYIWWLIPFESVYWMYALTVGTASLFWKPYWKGKKIN